MQYKNSEYSFASHTGNTDIFVQSIAPAGESDIKGVIQIVHGMAEYTDRYLDAAHYFCDNGFAVIMHDQAGHGKSVKTDDDNGYFCEKDGYKMLVEDVYEVTKLARSNFSGKKVILWGHSMGSFISRSYIAKYPDAVDAAVICGTAGKNPAAGAGILLANIVGKVKGEKYRSPFINNIAFGAYNKRFNGSTGFEWLSVNEENVSVYMDDPKCGFVFTVSGFRDLFNVLKSVSTDEWYNSVSKKLPIYLIAGADDPVGNYGKGVNEVYTKLKETGHNVSIKIYPGLRHEIHNENTGNLVYNDILAFANGI